MLLVLLLLPSGCRGNGSHGVWPNGEEGAAELAQEMAERHTQVTQPVEGGVRMAIRPKLRTKKKYISEAIKLHMGGLETKISSVQIMIYKIQKLNSLHFETGLTVNL